MTRIIDEASRRQINNKRTAKMKSAVVVFLLSSIVGSCAFSIRFYPATRGTVPTRRPPRPFLFATTTNEEVNDEPRQRSDATSSATSSGGSTPATTAGTTSDDAKTKHDVALEKATKSMTAFTNKYLANTGTTLCADKSVAAVVIKGLAEHKVALGTPLCPCRFYDDKVAEAKDGFWNCPCVPMRERHECHCMLFLTEDNAFAGTETNIAYDEVVALISKDID